MSRHELLDSNTHRQMRVLTGPSATMGDGVMACLTVPDEFRRVQAEFPIVFRRDIESGSFSALALFGFENGENLFLVDDQWQANYRPLSLTVQPFLIGRGAGDAAQVHVDMDHARITDADNAGLRLFDDDGQASPYLESIADQLGELNHSYGQSTVMYAALDQLGLLEPFTLEVPLNDASKHSLVGFHTIDEMRLANLDNAALAELHRQGYLMPLFMAVASLSQFSELVARKNRALASG